MVCKHVVHTMEVARTAIFSLFLTCFLSEISGKERFWTLLAEENGVFSIHYITSDTGA